ncbi:MAG: hypothetical protein Q4E34_00335 [Synergistaceae bacterium]|nr:hypothetical protein [Synergistaceae bacterium]
MTDASMNIVEKIINNIRKEIEDNEYRLSNSIEKEKHELSLVSRLAGQENNHYEIAQALAITNDCREDRAMNHGRIESLKKTLAFVEELMLEESMKKD